MPITVTEYLDDSAEDWVEQVPAISNGMPPVGGPVDLENDGGVSNMHAQGVARRTRFLRRAVEAELAVVGLAILSGGFAFSRDGDLVANRTPSSISPTGTTLAALLADGFTDEGLRSSALARAVDVTVSPVFPHVEVAGGRLSVTDNGDGTIRLDTGQSWLWRGGRRFSASDIPTANRIFSTAASKTYHVRWHAPGTGIATPASAYPSGRLELADMAGLSEADAQHDTTFDRMLIARVTTNGSNVSAITPLRNAARINDVVDVSPTVNNPRENLATFSQVLSVDLSRTPKVLSTLRRADVEGTMGDDDVLYNVENISRYSFRLSGLHDFSSSISLNAHFWVE